MAQPYEPTSDLQVTELDPDLTRRDFMRYTLGTLASLVTLAGASALLKNILTAPPPEADNKKLLEIRSALNTWINEVNTDPSTLSFELTNLKGYLEGIFLITFPEYQIPLYRLGWRIKNNPVTEHYKIRQTTEPVLLHLNEGNEYNASMLEYDPDAHKNMEQAGTLYAGLLAAAMPFLHAENHPIGPAGGPHSITGFTVFNGSQPLTANIDIAFAEIEFTRFLKGGLGYQDLPEFSDTSQYLLDLAKNNGFSQNELLLARHQSNHQVLAHALTGNAQFNIYSLIDTDREISG